MRFEDGEKISWEKAKAKDAKFRTPVAPDRINPFSRNRGMNVDVASWSSSIKVSISKSHLHVFAKTQQSLSFARQTLSRFPRTSHHPIGQQPSVLDNGILRGRRRPRCTSSGIPGSARTATTDARTDSDDATAAGSRGRKTRPYCPAVHRATQTTSDGPTSGTTTATTDATRATRTTGRSTAYSTGTSKARGPGNGELSQGTRIEASHSYPG